MTQPLESNFGHEASRGSQFDDYIAAFSREATNPPGNDKCMGAFYTALTSLSTDNKGFNAFLATITTRRKLTPQHFTNLMFRTTQYLELFEKKNDNYPLGYSEPNQWVTEIPELLEQYGSLMEELLLTKDTTTTIYQRYAGTLAVLSGFFAREKLKVADFGCGGNYGLPGLIKSIPFKTIDDQTPNKIVTTLIKHHPDIDEGLAIDKVDPQDPKEKAWRLACSFYPQELGQLEDLMDFEASIADVRTVKFLQTDLVTLDVDHFNNRESIIPKEYFDAVVMNTLCYQLDPQEQKRMLEVAERSIKSDGLLIVQDFVRKDPAVPNHLEFLKSWFTEQFPYRTFIWGASTNWIFKEFLQWSNGRCLGVRKGEDFKELLGNYMFNSSRRLASSIKRGERG